MTKPLSIVACFAAVCAISIGVYFAWAKPDDGCGSANVIAGNAKIGGPFNLVSHHGKQVTEKDVITGLTLIYFGYTFCPDVCPLDMARNIEAIDILKEDGLDVTPVFITIDPARDTQEALSDYVDVMYEKMIALTGTLEQVDNASKAYRTYYRKNGEGEDYLMDHSTFTYLMSPTGFLEYFHRELTPEEVAKKTACFAK